MCTSKSAERNRREIRSRIFPERDCEANLDRPDQPSANFSRKAAAGIAAEKKNPCIS